MSMEPFNDKCSEKVGTLIDFLEWQKWYIITNSDSASPPDALGSVIGTMLISSYLLKLHQQWNQVDTQQVYQAVGT